MKFHKIFLILVLALLLAPADVLAQNRPQDRHSDKQSDNQPNKPSDGLAVSSKNHPENNWDTIQRDTYRKKNPALPDADSGRHRPKYPPLYKPDYKDRSERPRFNDHNRGRDHRGHDHDRGYDHSCNQCNDGISVNVEFGPERYYHRNDLSKWPQASSQFSLGLQASYFTWLNNSSRLEFEVEELFDQVDAQVAARMAVEPEMTVEEQRRMSMVLLRGYVEDNIKSLAIDQDGAYHILLNDQNEEEEWIKTSVTQEMVRNASNILNQQFNQQSLPAARTQTQNKPLPPSQAVNDRYRAAADAWKN
ncbi:MAG: hypothetical protein LBT62_05125 [Deltaproteobacteria bacterium]|nr:hypothetical protein [Deltaproteobacteria bacterium]